MKAAAEMQTDITISLSEIVWLAGGITAIVAFVKWVLTPVKKIEDHETRITNLEEARDERRATDQYMMSALNAIINHMIDNNSIDKLKEVRDEYQEQIIRHHH